jgi:hypothetical protein
MQKQENDGWNKKREAGRSNHPTTSDQEPAPQEGV